MVLHSWRSRGHPREIPYALEKYAREVALELDGLRLEGVVVRESPERRRFDRLLNKYDSRWLLDLHSDLEPYDLVSEYMRQSTLVGSVEVVDDYALGLLGRFKKESEHNVHVDYYYSPEERVSRNPQVLNVALLWYRPLKSSVEFLKSLCQFLREEPLRDKAVG